MKLRRRGATARAPARPLAKLKHLLEPRSAAIMGVSEKLNPGHIIVNNLIREGFARERIYIVKPGSDGDRGLPLRARHRVAARDGWTCSSSRIDAAQAPQAHRRDHRAAEKAESIVLIPGGLEEKAGSEAIVARMHEALAAARGERVGRPAHQRRQLPRHPLAARAATTRCSSPSTSCRCRAGAVVAVAIVSQSGAFAVSQVSKLGRLNPKYSITLGNQMDLTVGDYLTYLKDDPTIDVFAVYVEGFTAARRPALPPRGARDHRQRAAPSSSTAPAARRRARRRRPATRRRSPATTP